MYDYVFRDEAGKWRIVYCGVLQHDTFKFEGSAQIFLRRLRGFFSSERNGPTCA